MKHESNIARKMIRENRAEIAAQQESKPEPAGLFVPARRDLLGRVTRWDQVDGGGEPLYLHPPEQQERKPMLASDIVMLYAECPTSDADMIEFAREVEAFHGIKETP